VLPTRYFVGLGDTCAQIAASNSLTIDDIENFNSDTWGWMGCGDLQADQNICLSTGNPPLPAAISNALCGPQVPGTVASTNGTALSQLNQCPLNACCDIFVRTISSHTPPYPWNNYRINIDLQGQCGISPDFCTPSNSSTGAPGSAAPGQNGCISNCGTDIVNNDEGPESIFNIAYFEAFNLQRPCQNMGADEIPTNFTHIHFAFANITSGYQVDVSGVGEQFELFITQTGFKRIISFGGWAFSTDPSTFDIFRTAVQEANRGTLVTNMVDFANQVG
jgi:chitinase